MRTKHLNIRKRQVFFFILQTCFLFSSNGFHLQQSLPRVVRRTTKFTQLRKSASENIEHDPVLRLPLMEAELALATQEGSSKPDQDTTSEISQLQMAISDAKTAAEFGVRKSQVEFYSAFANGDLDAMGQVWSTESHVRCVHPGMTGLEGREAVLQSWKQIFASKSDSSETFEIEPSNTQIEICGLTAICTCVEKTEGGGQLEALNIYKREGGSWRMTLHMAGPVLVRDTSGGFF